MSRQNPLIKVRNLKKTFDEKVVLDGIDFDLMPGESLVVIGGSGTGKSVLIKCILDLVQADCGEIIVDGTDILKASPDQKQKALDKVGMLFQGGALFDSLTIWENICFSLVQSHVVTRKEAKEIAIEKLKAVNLGERVADLLPAELSGGMQKRVALARAIATNPKIIFFDEPTTGLDPIVSCTINQLIQKCVKEIGASAITITHDLASLRQIADHVALLFNGKIIWKGTVKEMDSTNNPYVRQFVDGRPDGPYITTF